MKWLRDLFGKPVKETPIVESGPRPVTLAERVAGRRRWFAVLWLDKKESVNKGFAIVKAKNKCHALELAWDVDCNPEVGGVVEAHEIPATTAEAIAFHGMDVAHANKVRKHAKAKK